MGIRHVFEARVEGVRGNQVAKVRRAFDEPTFPEVFVRHHAPTRTLFLSGFADLFSTEHPVKVHDRLREALGEQHRLWTSWLNIEDVDWDATFDPDQEEAEEEVGDDEGG